MKSLATFALIAGCLLAPFAVYADDALWADLQRGGRVLLIRHGLTTPGVGDPPGMRLDDCSTQRNLNDEGRRHARAIGEAFRARRIPVDRVLSSPWCRCIETARLAFDRTPQAEVSLSNLFGRSERAGQQVAAMQRLVSEHRGPGNLVLVSHGSTIGALTGVSPATGEIVVVAPDAQRGFVVDGRLRVESR